MKVLITIVLLSVLNTSWLAGGAPPQLFQGSKDNRRNGTLVEQKGQEDPSEEVSLATEFQKQKTKTEQVASKNLAGINRGEDHGNNNNTNPISHPITDSDLQNQLNELRRNPGQVNRKEDIGSISAENDEDKHLQQTITLDREYTPQDIAEYIFWTGDERGVAVGISNLLNDGLMLSQDDVIQFLENVKSELDYLRNRYELSLSRLTPSKPPPLSELSSSPISKSRFLRHEGHDEMTSSYSSSKGSVQDFESKFQALLLRQALLNNKNRAEEEDKEKDSDVTTGGGGGIRSLNKARRISSAPVPAKRLGFGLGAYHLPISKKKNSRASAAPLTHYFSQIAQTTMEDPTGYNSYDNNNIEEIRNHHSNNKNNLDFSSKELQKEMKVADDRLKELFLRDIIYNLARELFAENFKQGGKTESF